MQTIEEKTSLELVAQVTGTPAPEVRWFRDDVELQPTVKVSFISEDDGIYKLAISSTSPAMTGQYKVVAVNAAGQADHVATVTITGESNNTVL